ncbi:MAG: histidine kinase, partial [Burkholderiales bacterium]|nr:histidine kinase [Burkholderiales bacterium]
MSAAAPALARPAAAEVPPTAGGGRERARTRALFAAAYALIVFAEAVIFDSGVYASAFRFTLGQHALSACIDGGAWWLCVALVERGFRLRAVRPAVYVVATLAAAIVATWLHLVTQTWYFAPRADLNEGRAYATIWMLHLYGLWRAAAVTILYCFRLRSVSDAASLHAARVEQAALARQAIEANLRALQGRVDPRFLFESLAQVERLCDAAPERADRILDALIAYLRAALPEADAPARTLADELTLVEAYVALVRARADGEVALVVDADAAAQAAALPPSLLLPLVEHACAGGADGRAPLVLTIAGLVDRGRLRVSVNARGR